ncbi:MAG: hypothetical protein KBT27_03455 [Prevotellaceae bacterium]|nr:hypothetical protein [Candidatus Faecinaster equi]
MSLIDYSNGTPSVNIMPSGFGNGTCGFGGDGAWWLIVLFLFAANNGWGNGYGGNSGCYSSEMQRGFDQQSVMNGLNGVSSQLSAAEVSRCNTQANLLQAINNVGTAQQNCCCENRLATANLVSTIQAENFANRDAISNGIRDLLTATSNQTQTILDKMCQQEIDALKTQNANLQTQINLANLQASQTAQTARILADNAAQTLAVEQYLNPTPIPAYVVQNPNCCTQNYYTGCGCGA